MNNNHKIATIINYCTNDYKFINHCIREAKIFSDQVIVSLCDHFHDGTPENRELLDKTYKEYSANAEFHEYRYDSNTFANLKFCAVHAYSRLEGLKKVRDDIDYIVFLDADEIFEGARFKEYLDKSDFRKYNAIMFSNYYYFRDVTFRAKKWEDSVIMVKRDVLTSEMMENVIAQGQDRMGIVSVLPELRIRNVPGINGIPMIHHYSWVRTKEEMIKKVQTFGHKSDLDWESLIEKEFLHDFNGTDFVNGYEYEVVEPYIKIKQNRKQRCMYAQ